MYVMKYVTTSINKSILQYEEKMKNNQSSFLEQLVLPVAHGKCSLINYGLIIMYNVI